MKIVENGADYQLVEDEKSVLQVSTYENTFHNNHCYFKFNEVNQAVTATEVLRFLTK